MNRTAWILILVLVLLGLGIFLTAPRGGHPSHLEDLLFWSPLVLFLSLFRVSLPIVGRVNMGFVGVLAASTLLPPQWTLLIGAMGYLDPRFIWYKELFNRVQLGASAGLASYLYHMLSPSPLAFPVSALGYFLVNASSLLLLFRSMGMDPKILWRRQYRPLSLTYLGLAPVAFLMAELYREPPLGLWKGAWPLILIFPTFFVWRMWEYQVHLVRAAEGVVRGLVNLLEAKDPYTAHHSERVAAIAWDIGREIGLSPEELQTLHRAATLHDIGKVGIPDATLRKPTGFQEEEWEVMRTHPGIGYQALAPLLPYLGNIGPGILYHHERFDGRGYPEGLTGNEIPLIARIIAVADAYEAMTADRPYRQAKPPEEAMKEILDLSGIQFDRRVVQAFLRAWEKDPPWREKGRFVHTLV